MAHSKGALRLLRDLPGSRRLPVLGHSYRICFERLHLILEDWAERYGPMFRIHIGPYGIAVISDRPTIQRILVQCPEAFRRKAMKPVAPRHILETVADAEILRCLIPKGTPIMMLV